MTIAEVLQEVVVVQERLRGLLDNSGQRAIEGVRVALAEEQQRQANMPVKKRRPTKWTLRLRPDLPLSFAPTLNKETHRLLQIDIYCEISSPPDSAGHYAHNLVMRVWSLEEGLSYRDGWDAPGLKDQLEGKSWRRVMHRVHFDLANKGQAGPKFHLQFGGGARDDEHCWFPSGLDVPRFAHHPMTLITACEFALRTFFPKEHPSICKDGQWVSALRKSQAEFVLPYFQRALTTSKVANQQIVVPDSLLDALWNGVA